MWTNSPREGAYYFTDSRYIEAAEKNLKGFTVRMTHPGSSEIERINEVIGEHTIKKLGFEENDMTYGDYLRYNEALHAVLVPMQAKIDAFRATKEPWEIELMRKAQAITDQTFSELCKIIQAGMTEKELEAELLYRLYKHGAEGPSFDPIVVSGPNTSLPHGVPGERKLEFGDFITMDFGCIYGGYCSDMTRTVALGFVSEEMDKVYKTVLKAQLAGIAATKAGVAGRDIDGTARKVIADAGYGDYFGHGYGHSLGILIHEAPNANTRNDQPMPAGAVVSAEPGIYLPGKFGVRIEDVTVITETGCEVLTKSPKNLIIL